MYEDHFPKKRYQLTFEFLSKKISKDAKILDLGVVNPFSDLLSEQGFQITNTSGEDLDINTTSVQTNDYEVVTAFEIFEHLLAPFNVLKDIKAKKLVASVPLKLWFSPAYQSKTDMRDRHYHEFEDWQFDWLLEKSGWIIKDRIQFTNPVNKFGFRPLLRKFVPRYYLVYAERA